MQRGPGSRPGVFLAGAVAASAFLAGPLFRTFGSLVMLEVPGLLLLAACLWAAFRVLDGDGVGSEARWRRLWLLSSALFFCKYNYGVTWLAGLFLAEGVRRSGSWADLWATIRARISVAAWRRAEWPLRVGGVILGLLAGLVLVLRRTGGVETAILGQEPSLSSVGNPAQALALLFALALAVREWRRARADGEGLGARLVRRLDALALADRTCVLYLLLPIGAWLLVPPHLRQMVRFLENRSSGLGVFDAEFWWIYPRAWLELYSPHPAVGLALAALAVFFVLRSLVGRAPASHRLLALVLLVHLGSILAHPYKLPRFAFGTAGLVILAASVGASVLVAGLVADLALGRPRTRSFVAALLIGLLAVGLLVGAASWGWDDGRLQRELRWRTAPASTSAVLEALGDPELGPRLLVLGTWNLLSPALVEWQELSLHWDGDGPGVSMLTDFELARRRPHRLRSALERGGPDESPIDTVLVLELDPSAGSVPSAELDEGEIQLFASETAWLEPVRAALEAGELPYREVGVETALGSVDRWGVYRWRIYRREGGQGPRSL